MTLITQEHKNRLYSITDGRVMFKTDLETEGYFYKQRRYLTLNKSNFSLYKETSIRNLDRYHFEYSLKRFLSDNNIPLSATLVREELFYHRLKNINNIKSLPEIIKKDFENIFYEVLDNIPSTEYSQRIVTIGELCYQKQCNVSPMIPEAYVTTKLLKDRSDLVETATYDATQHRIVTTTKELSIPLNRQRTKIFPIGKYIITTEQKGSTTTLSIERPDGWFKTNVDEDGALTPYFVLSNEKDRNEEEPVCVMTVFGKKNKLCFGNADKEVYAALVNNDHHYLHNIVLTLITQPNWESSTPYVFWTEIAKKQDATRYTPCYHCKNYDNDCICVLCECESPPHKATRICDTCKYCIGNCECVTCDICQQKTIGTIFDVKIVVNKPHRYQRVRFCNKHDLNKTIEKLHMYLNKYPTTNAETIIEHNKEALQ